jgi:hypothetical protein
MGPANAPYNDEQDYEEAVMSIPRLRADGNRSPHGAIGEKARNATISVPAFPRSTGGIGSASHPSFQLSSLSASSLATSRDNEDEQTFKNDLAHVLVWFKEDLSSNQRFIALFTLAQHLTSLQQSMLAGCLTTNDAPSSKITEAQVSDASCNKPRTSPIDKWMTIGSPQPVHPFPGRPIGPMVSRFPSPSASTSSPTLSLATTTGVTEESLEDLSLGEEYGSRSFAIGNQTSNCRPDLFFSNIPAWLRLHRLHKYSGILAAYPPHTLLTMDESTLQRLGVHAMGARMKLCRLFALVRQHSSGQ